MKAARIHQFGPPDVIVIDDVPRPAPGAGEVLVRVSHAGVGPWDALIREGKSAVPSPLPITLGSDLSGIVEAIGAGVTTFQPGDEIYGVTNPEFVGAQAEFAVARANMIGRKPASLSFAQAASAPLWSPLRRWQMLFDYAKAASGQTVLIHGAAGNVGAYSVKLAAQAGLHVTATASAKDEPYVRSLGAAAVVDYHGTRFEDVAPNVDIVLDMIGGETQKRSFAIIKPGGILVSVVSEPADSATLGNVRAVFFLVEVTTERLETLTDLFNRGQLLPRVGSVLPLEDTRIAHEMLTGAPHKPGKIVLSLAALA